MFPDPARPNKPSAPAEAGATPDRRAE